MLQHLDIWKFIAGLGMFLFAMNQLEYSLKSLAGRTFKLFLKHYTSNNFKSILSGAFVTAILQSSSVVSLITLAFVGARIISMKSALGIIFGSNLGTTFTGWIVALIGFKLDIESFALPMIGIGGILMIVLSKQTKLMLLGQLFISFGFLFLGLDFMKVSVDVLAQEFDLSMFSGYQPWHFLIVGFVFTAIVQSSSASMVITLSALSSGIIPFSSAAAMVIGSDLGTTITALIGGMPGIPPKKRVALGHFIFNLITDVIAFACLGLLIKLITQGLGVIDELVALVMFHSMFNLLGILLFLPFINTFASFLEKRFAKEDRHQGIYIHNVSFDIVEVAIEALNKETQVLIQNSIHLMKMPFESSSGNGDLRNKQIAFKERYHVIKRLEGEIFIFYNQLQKEQLDEELSSRLNQLILTIRYALHAVKGIKDIEPNIAELEHSSSSEMNSVFNLLNHHNSAFVSEIEKIVESQDLSSVFEDLAEQLIVIQAGYDEVLDRMNKEHKLFMKMEGLEISTILTINRELYSAYKSLIMSSASFLLSADQAREFNNLPAYK